MCVYLCTYTQQHNFVLVRGFVLMRALDLWMGAWYAMTERVSRRGQYCCMCLFLCLLSVLLLRLGYGSYTCAHGCLAPTMAYILPKPDTFPASSFLCMWCRLCACDASTQRASCHDDDDDHNDNDDDDDDDVALNMQMQGACADYASKATEEVLQPQAHAHYVIALGLPIVSSKTKYDGEVRARRSHLHASVLLMCMGRGVGGGSCAWFALGFMSLVCIKQPYIATVNVYLICHSSSRKFASYPTCVMLLSLYEHRRRAGRDRDIL